MSAQEELQLLLDGINADREALDAAFSDKEFMNSLTLEQLKELRQDLQVLRERCLDVVSMVEEHLPDGYPKAPK